MNLMTDCADFVHKLDYYNSIILVSFCAQN